MWKQVQFKVLDGGKILGGIAFYEDNRNLKEVICGCCGCTFEPDEIEVIQVYENWMNLCEAIIGE